jgi:hypothetical protein
MTSIAALITAVLATGAVAAGGVMGEDARPARSRTALVIDAAAARDGRALIDDRLRSVDADVRVPRTAFEARTDVRYFAARGYDRVVVVGPQSRAAAAQGADVGVREVEDLAGALAAVGR